MDKIPTGTWVVVADGAQARLFTNVGTDTQLTLRQDELIGQGDLAGGPGDMPDDLVKLPEIGEAAFARQLAHTINAAALKNRFEHIVLVADPQTLGRMRPLLHKETSARLVGELPKTLTNSPLEDIERALH
jgi:protein required for attachment to host cells